MVLELPVITVIHDNHAYSGPHSRLIGKVPDGRMVETGHFVHDYLGKPHLIDAQVARVGVAWAAQRWVPSIRA